jgi:hypothetical protein
MVAAHAHLEITASDWSVFLQLLSQTFEALAVEPTLRTELREAVDGRKVSIVTEKR